MFSVTNKGEENLAMTHHKEVKYQYSQFHSIAHSQKNVQDGKCKHLLHILRTKFEEINRSFTQLSLSLSLSLSRIFKTLSCKILH